MSEITNEAEANTADVGTVIRDSMRDVFEKVSDTGWQMTGVDGKWGPTWIAYPAAVLIPDPDGERWNALNDLFLRMRDRVAGWVDAPPVARRFKDGVTAFEWAATIVRRARDGQELLEPPVPGANREATP